MATFTAAGPDRTRTQMHAEWGEVTEDAAAAIQASARLFTVRMAALRRGLAGHPLVPAVRTWKDSTDRTLTCGMDWRALNCS